jgi:hypothetical protein
MTTSTASVVLAADGSTNPMASRAAHIETTANAIVASARLSLIQHHGP